MNGPVSSLKQDSESNSSLSPMLKQYQTIKAKHQDCILFFRLGDFYEMFYDDAKIACKVLDLVLTARGKGTANKVPMCGFPYHSAENYIAKLIKAGHKVAICEQMEDPGASKGIVKRDVTRIITSGTYLDEKSSATQYILCLSPEKDRIAAAFCDPSSGTIHTNQYALNIKTIVEIISKLPITECVYPVDHQSLIEDIFCDPLIAQKKTVLSPYEEWCFNSDIARKTLLEHYQVHNLHGFGIDNLELCVSAAGALLEYLRQMNKQPLKHMDKISVYHNDQYVYISPAAENGLELSRLVKTIDYTLTAMGKRNLYQWFYHPLKNIDEITRRQKSIQQLLQHPDIQARIKELFSPIVDIEKCISRLSCGYSHPKDLLAIRNTLALIPDIQQALSKLSNNNDFFQLSDIPDLRNLLLSSVNENTPLSNYEGKVIKEGFHKELDALRDIQNNGREWLKNFQQNEIKRTSINSLKVGFNKVFGYYIEITRTHAKNVPQDYIRKQTLVNAERYITPELKEYEEKILTAQDKVVKIENEIIHSLTQEILKNSLLLHQFTEKIAVIDTLYSLSLLAQAPQYILPSLSNHSLIDIKEGRHPVVEQMTYETFVSNDTLLDCDKQHLVILTGPNMAGKSTYIRQTAILVIMAQVGSFIPAQSAAIGIVDKVFTRIGAHDDISKGQSTFMVEMNETADILNNVTEKSLVILDEIGRGTSTFDGLSLAWALAEHLNLLKVRTLFATHFHELTALADTEDGVVNYNVAVKKWKDEIVFMHKIVPGGSDDSYGIYVAKLAGIPHNIIDRAKTILTQLELKGNLKEDLKNNFQSTEKQLSLFTQQPDANAEEIKTAIRAIDTNNMTPLEALNKLQEIKQLLEETDSQ